MTPSQAQIDKATAQRAALIRNAGIRRASTSPNATRPLTLKEWRAVRPNKVKRAWLRVARFVEAITQQLTPNR